MQKIQNTLGLVIVLTVNCRIGPRAVGCPHSLGSDKWRSYQTLCLEVVNINGLALQCVLQNLQTVEICRAAIKQNKGAVSYINMYLFELDEIFAEYTIPVVKEIVNYKTIQVDEIVNSKKIIYFDSGEKKTYIYKDYEATQSSIDDLINRSVNKKDKSVSSVKKSASGTIELYYKEKKTVNVGKVFNHFVEVEEEKLLGVIDPNPTIVL